MAVDAPPLTLDPDRLLPADPAERAIARQLYEAVRELPVISPHGHVDPRLLLDNEPFSDPATLLVTPDHYVTRLLHADGGGLDDLARRVDAGFLARLVAEHRLGEDEAAETVIDLVSGRRREVFML